AALADQLQQLVAAGDEAAGGDVRGAVLGAGGVGVGGGRLQLVLAGGVGGEQGLDAPPEVGVAGAGLVEEGLAVGGVGALQGGQEQGFFGHGRASAGYGVLRAIVTSGNGLRNPSPFSTAKVQSGTSRRPGPPGPASALRCTFAADAVT